MAGPQMTYQTERSAIETYIAANWGGPIGFDAQAFTPTAGSLLVTINSGAVLQGSIGRTANVIEHVGTLVLTYYSDGGKGSAAWRGVAETLTDLLFEKSLTTAGIIAGADVFVRFSPPQLGDARHPYISASFAETPFHITNLTAPFVRYETR